MEKSIKTVGDTIQGILIALLVILVSACNEQEQPRPPVIDLQSFQQSAGGESWTNASDGISVKLKSFLGEPVPSKIAYWPLVKASGSITVHYNYAMSSSTNDYTLTMTIGLMDENLKLIEGCNTSLVNNTGTASITSTSKGSYLYVRALVDYPSGNHSAHVTIHNLKVL